MDKIKSMSIRIEENSERANNARKFLHALPKDSLMYKMDSILASGEVYELPLIPYTGHFANRLFFKVNESGSYSLYTMNGYLQELAVVTSDNSAAYLCHEVDKGYVKNAVEWIKNHR